MAVGSRSNDKSNEMKFSTIQKTTAGLLARRSKYTLPDLRYDYNAVSAYLTHPPLMFVCQ